MMTIIHDFSDNQWKIFTDKGNSYWETSLIATFSSVGLNSSRYSVDDSLVYYSDSKQIYSGSSLTYEQFINLYPEWGI